MPYFGEKQDLIIISSEKHDMPLITKQNYLLIYLNFLLKFIIHSCI